MSKSLFLATCVTLLASPLAKAAIVVTAPEEGALEGSISITAPITFEVYADATEVVYLVLDEWVTTDGSMAFIYTDSELETGGSMIDYSVNGQATQSGKFSYLIVNPDESSGDVTPKDGLMDLSSINFSSGNQLTLFAKTWSGRALGEVNPEAYQTFTGNVFLTNNIGERISNIVAVPEPAAFAALASLGALGLALTRRRPRLALL